MRTSRSFHPVVFLLVALVPTFGNAQKQPVQPIRNREFESTQDAEVLKLLVSAYNDNQWDSVAALAESLLSVDGTEKGHQPWDYGKDYISAVFVAPATNGEDQLIRILVHDKVRPYSTILPGLSEKSDARLYEVMITAVPRSKLRSAYVFEAVSDGLQDRLAGFLKSSIDLTSLAHSFPPPRHAGFYGKTGQVWLVASQVPCPMPNAKISIHSDAEIPVNMTKSTKVRADFALVNHPTQRFGLGAGTAIIAKGGERRAKTDGGKIVRDPTRGPATAALLDYYVLGFNPASQGSPFAKRLRLSAGVLVTPDPGITVQVGVMPFPVNSITINYGVGIAWQRSLRERYKGFDDPNLGSATDPSAALTVRGNIVHTIGLEFGY